MEYILVIYTVVAAFGQGTGSYAPHEYHDWRPIGTFVSTNDKNAIDKCQDAAASLGVKTGNWRCVRSK